MVITQKPLTLEEFLEIPERKPALEYEEGVMTQKPMPKGKHSVLQGALTQLFNRFLQPQKLALAFPELRFTYAGRSYVPDVSLYRWDRIPRDEAGEVANDFFEPPDVAVEIVSPKQSVTALVRRCVWYVANGVAIALLVDPSDRSVLTFRLRRSPEALRGTDRIDLGDLLPGLTLTVQELFDSLRVQI